MDATQQLVLNVLNIKLPIEIGSNGKYLEETEDALDRLWVSMHPDYSKYPDLFARKKDNMPKFGTLPSALVQMSRFVYKRTKSEFNFCSFLCHYVGINIEMIKLKSLLNKYFCSVNKKDLRTIILRSFFTHLSF